MFVRNCFGNNGSEKNVALRMDPEQVGTGTGGSNIRVADLENW